MDPVTASLAVAGTQAASAVGTNVANALMYKRQRADNRQAACVPPTIKDAVTGSILIRILSGYYLAVLSTCFFKSCHLGIIELM